MIMAKVDDKENGMGIEKEDYFEKVEVSGMLDSGSSERKTITITAVIFSQPSLTDKFCTL